MKRKHYQAIADAIRVNLSGSGRDQIVWDVVDDLCVEFNRLNSRFDENKFRAACRKCVEEPRS